MQLSSQILKERRCASQVFDEPPSIALTILFVMMAHGEWEHVPDLMFQYFYYCPFFIAETTYELPTGEDGNMFWEGDVNLAKVLWADYHKGENTVTFDDMIGLGHVDSTTIGR
jgi:hypothetical protein